MQYIQFRAALKDFTVFSIQDARKVERNFDRRRLVEWQEKGYIQKVLKGYYIFSDLKLNEAALFEIANRIYSPSYVSLETALSYYGLIPEGVFAVTSISTRKTSRFKADIGAFTYRTIRSRNFWGYKLMSIQPPKVIRIASIEKALLDYFYINPHLNTKDDFESLRINTEPLFEQLDEAALKTGLKQWGQKTLTRRVKAFLEVMRHA